MASKNAMGVSGSSQNSTGAADPSGKRSKYLDRVFRNVSVGTLKITRYQIARDFIESILAQQDKTACLERLASSKEALEGLHKALTFTDAAQFMNTAVSDLLNFFADPELKRLCDGELLNHVLWAIADPPLFWSNLLKSARNGVLDSKAIEGFTWLLLHLVMLPSAQSKDFRETAISLFTQEDTPLVSTSPKAEQLIQQIRVLVSPPSVSGPGLVPPNVAGPGGRHDNDFVNYRDVVILPTRAELLSTERSYYLSAASVAGADATSRASTHLDNQFRLLREDMVGAMQEEFQNVARLRPRRRRNIFIQQLRFVQFDDSGTSATPRDRPCTFVFQCSYDFLSQHLSIQGTNNLENRKKALKKTQASFFLRHQSFGCLLQNNNVLGFASVDRNEDKLALDPPQLCLRITSPDSVEQVFNALQTQPIDYLELSVPLFAYEPILERLKSKVEVELSSDILGLCDPSLSPLCPQDIVRLLQQVQPTTSDLRPILGLSKSVHLDPSQIQALIHGLTYQVSLIQGPPGTGKSLVGAILGKILLEKTDETLLVLSYTNHALDQFIEDLMDIGIDNNLIVRLGSKSTPRTAPLLLSNQHESGPQRRWTRRELISSQRDSMNRLLEMLKEACADFQKNVSTQQLLENLLFSPTDAHFHDALSLPETPEGETVVGAGGRKAKPDYLFRRWQDGKNAGIFTAKIRNQESKSVWNLSKEDRLAKIQGWKDELRREKLQEVITHIKEFNKCYKTLQGLKKEKTENILRSKRIIACTTTAASMCASEIQAARPGIVLVEEAGEILESHILAAMGPTTKQLIQIGDHKQLRPKVANYRLSVECANGYDLNRSLFERLVLLDRPSCTLLNQHRMRPEISELIRHNYPDLRDAKGTENRPHLLGFQHDVIFVNHKNPEAKHDSLFDKTDPTMKSSKQNEYEANMVIKCVRYLGQQNYKTDNIVILTPYLGQLKLLKDKLSDDHDPVLSDFDSHELVQAGILPAASAAINKKPIRLSTIDNYQGEESDIVIVSLTRSNEDGEIGFMAAPERLNVLVSRARDALLMIGNAETFMRARKGGDEWHRLLDRLKLKGQVHDGFPVRCEKHPDHVRTLRSPDEFDLHCPDGGCAEPCTELVSCGQHTCPKRCHIRVDHSQIPCSQVMEGHCSNGHKLSWQCATKRAPPCQTCRQEKEEKARKARRDQELELERQARQHAYAKQLAAVREQIERRRQEQKDRREEKEREQTLRQYREELARIAKEDTMPLSGSGINSSPSTNTAATSSKPLATTAKPNKSGAANDQNNDQQPNTTPAPTLNRTADDSNGNADDADSDDCQDTAINSEPANDTVVQEPSPAESDWQRQKKLELASNEALDSLMEMIGLETVKAEFLNIKARVDTAIRQDVDLKGDRFGAALLGNPGTGKTTVARLYGKFLSSVGVIPGSHFEETTGSRLAHDGIQGAQTLLDNLLKSGGGVFFLDEAYQIVSGSSLGGSQVLDFLLAEIENLTGKVVFVFAGYRKQMEAFFAHNPGIPSRIPIRLDFEDYKDHELLQIMRHAISKKYSGRMAIEGGPGGLYMRIAARRIARGRGREGFGNAREVHNVLDTLLRRQADRLHKSRRKGETPDDLLLTKIDIIGPEPSRAIAANEDWQRLQKMIGLKSVKQSIQVLIDRLQTNYERELNEQPLVECSLNKVFVGNPGTGKTTVAKHYGKILAALGLLSNGEVIIKNPADFVGSALGQSEKNTKAILEATKGKVLIIDEAYMLGSGLSGTGGVSDPYKTAVIDTIVAEVQSTSLEDRCVLLLGYQSLMEDMFQKVNPGLARRFPMSSAFVFEDYDDLELRSILDLKLKQQGFRAGEATKKAVISVLARARNRPNFGNAGEVDIVLDQAKERQQKRLAEVTGPKKTDWLAPEDVDPDFNRLERAETNIKMLFKDVVGCEEVIQKLEEYQQLVQNMKGEGFSDADVRAQVPFGLLFRGPPGTGKTSTARKMGKIYYDLGLLTEAKVIDCSATDLIGQYVGQTGPKVQKKFDEALGRVLFVDEAYRLAEGHFAKEAMDEIVDCLTKERYHNKILVILAGYDDDINRLMNQNPGLTSRFPETIAFHHMPPRHCRKLLLQCLSMKKLDTTQLESSLTLDITLLDLFGRLAQTSSWGNARDVQTLAKTIFSRVMRTKTKTSSRPARVVTEDVVLEVLNSMIAERSNRGNISASMPPEISNIQAPIPQPEVAFQNPPPQHKMDTGTAISTTQSTEEVTAGDPKEQDDDASGPKSKRAPRRDAGVSDEVWEQLQRDKEAAERRQQELAASRRKAAQLEREMREKEEALQRERDDAARREVLRKLEAARAQWEQAERERKEKEERMRKEAEMKAKLMKMGRCPMGYEWIPQANGYRCAGGSHFMSNVNLGV